MSAVQNKANAEAAQRKKQKRQKVDHACVYCRRSHMTCDNKRPCTRCIKRSIGHLCHDEPKPRFKDLKREDTDEASETSSIMSPGGVAGSVPASTSGARALVNNGGLILNDNSQSVSNWSSSNGNGNGISGLGDQMSSVSSGANSFSNTPFSQAPIFFSEHAGSEFSSLNNFLAIIDEPGPLNADGFSVDPTSGMSSLPSTDGGAFPRHGGSTSLTGLINEVKAKGGSITASDTARDKFFMTAADPSEDISPEERLKQVIYAKLEAGLLQPFNYVNGYQRLQKYMDTHMNQNSKQRILKALSIFRPTFRAVAQSLNDVDLVLVEEAFERMLLDYDRVFTSMAIPACLWRRTGEIYRGNREFAGLVEVDVEDLRDGKLAIYELMSEESAVNYWEKYGNIAFDSGQKAVLTSCNLRTRDGRKRRACCFSFTIRRDKYNIPSCIIGNFIPIHP